MQYYNTWCLYFLLGIILTYTTGINGILLEEFGDPIAFEEGTLEKVDIDCPYSLQDTDEEDIVVKWRHNKDEAAFYQWIPFSPPSVIDSLSDKIDLDHITSDSDYERHRGLSLLNPSSEFSGIFTCIVSGIKEEKTHTRKVIAYSPPTSVTLDLDVINDTHVALWCDTGESFPEPNVYITRSVSGGKINLKNVDIKPTWSDGKYNVSAKAIIEDEILREETLFECHLTFPDTNFAVATARKYMPKNAINLIPVELNDIEESNEVENDEEITENEDNFDSKEIDTNDVENDEEITENEDNFDSEEIDTNDVENDEEITANEDNFDSEEIDTNDGGGPKEEMVRSGCEQRAVNYITMLSFVLIVVQMIVFH